MSSAVLSDKDTNTNIAMNQQTPTDGDAANATKSDVKSMEYHRQVLQSKMAEETQEKYISPSDNIMSPCSAKLNAYRNKQVNKAKPKSLFAQASAKKLDGDNVLGGRNTATTPPSSKPSSGL